MVHYLAVLRKRPDWTIEQFYEHWRDVHGPLVSRLPGLRKYVQYFTQSKLTSEEQEDAIQGIAEIWFDSDAALQRALESAAGKLVGADVRIFFPKGDHYNHLLQVLEVRVIV